MPMLADRKQCIDCCICLNVCSFGELEVITDRYSFLDAYSCKG